MSVAGAERLDRPYGRVNHSAAVGCLLFSSLGRMSRLFFEMCTSKNRPPTCTFVLVPHIPAQAARLGELAQPCGDERRVELLLVRLGSGGHEEARAAEAARDAARGDGKPAVLLQEGRLLGGRVS